MRQKIISQFLEGNAQLDPPQTTGKSPSDLGRESHQHSISTQSPVGNSSLQSLETRSTPSLTVPNDFQESQQRVEQQNTDARPSVAPTTELSTNPLNSTSSNQIQDVADMTQEQHIQHAHIIATELEKESINRKSDNVHDELHTSNHSKIVNREKAVITNVPMETADTENHGAIDNIAGDAHVRDEQFLPSEVISPQSRSNERTSQDCSAINKDLSVEHQSSTTIGDGCKNVVSVTERCDLKKPGSSTSQPVDVTMTHDAFQQHKLQVAPKGQTEQQDHDLLRTSQLQIQRHEIEQTRLLTTQDQESNAEGKVIITDPNPDTLDQVRNVDASVPPVLNTDPSISITNTERSPGQTQIPIADRSAQNGISPENVQENVTISGSRRLTERYHASRSQLSYLIDVFERDPAPSAESLKEISQAIDMPMHNLVLWFKNRRARRKTKNYTPVPKSGRRSYVKSGIYSRNREKLSIAEDQDFLVQQDHGFIFQQAKPSIHATDLASDEKQATNHADLVRTKREHVDSEVLENPSSKRIRFGRIEEIIGEANPCQSWTSDECTSKCIAFFIKNTNGCNEEQTSLARGIAQHFFTSEMQNGLTLTSALQPLDISLSILDTIMNQFSSNGQQLCSGSRVILREFIAHIRSGKASLSPLGSSDGNESAIPGMINKNQITSPSSPSTLNRSALPSVPTTDKPIFVKNDQRGEDAANQTADEEPTNDREGVISERIIVSSQLQSEMSKLKEATQCGTESTKKSSV